MGEHETWFHLIPGVRSAEHGLAESFGQGWFFGAPLHGLPHVIMGLFVLGLLFVLGSRYRAHLAAAGDGGVVPESRFNARSVVEIICDAVLGMLEGIMGKKAARSFLPFIGAFAFFILFANLMGLVPGFLPATDSVNTTAAMAIMVFLATHIYGIKEHGMAHIKHMAGPVLVLAPLIFVIELISHLARPLSLSLRLAGNMIGDHKALAIFLGLIPIAVPIPMLGLGVIVCLVQTLVFCLLSAVYVGMAIEHAEEGHH